MRKIKLTTVHPELPQIFRVLDLTILHQEWHPEQNILVPIRSDQDQILFQKFISSGLDNLYPVHLQRFFVENKEEILISTDEDLQNNDVVSIHATKKSLNVLLRSSDHHHSLFMTNRCNNYCVMCSQPPTQHDDSWLVDQTLEIIQHMHFEPISIGLTGGEPLLLGEDLRLIIETITAKFPSTRIEILSNGRLIADTQIQNQVLKDIQGNLRWLIPLYGHADVLHDFVVQQHFAFEETLEGLYVLQKYQQPIQLRIVLIQPVLENLVEICRYIRVNLPFIHQIALIGCEPIGFALANKELVQVDIRDWWDTLQDAIDILQQGKLVPIFMNIPLCCLPTTLWPFAAKSISDWKNIYVEECKQCAVKQNCCGLFTWSQTAWLPSRLQAVSI